MTARLTRAAAALSVLLAVVIGVPVALARWGRWPLRGVPTWEQISDVPNTIVSDTAVFGALTLVAWSVWALFMASVVLEVAANVSGRDAPQLPLAGPLQRNARQLVAALLMTASVVGPLARAASSQPLPPGAPLASREHQTTESPAPAPSAPAPVAPVAAPADGPQIEVRRGDSPWELAERHLGDPMRWREIWDLNRERAQSDGLAWLTPDVIEPGWRLVLPPDARNVPSAPPAASSYTVVPGDSLSEIAAEQLGDAGRAMEIFELNQHAQSDGNALTDPDLIRPGWQLTLPAVSEPPAWPAPAPPPAPPADPPVPDQGSVESTSTTAPLPPATSAPPATSGPITSTSESPADSTGDGGERSTVGLLGGGLVAGGVLALLERRRRVQQRRRHRGDPPAIPPAALHEAERLLRSCSAPSALRVVDAALRAAAAGTGDLPPVHHVEVDGEQVTIALDRPEPAPAGFAYAGSQRWKSAVSPADLEALGATQAPPLPALCPVGSTPAGAEILIDLESGPVTTIVGDESVAAEMLASMARSLTTAPWVGHGRVITVGLDGADDGTGIESGESLADALQACSQRAGSIENALTSMGFRTAPAARRSGTAPDAWDPVVVLSAEAASDSLAQALDGLKPLRGVAVCTLATAPSGRVLTLVEGGMLSLDGVDVPLVPGRLRLVDSNGVTRLLEQAAGTPTPMPEDMPPPARLPTPAPADGRDAVPSSNGSSARALLSDVDVLVRVLGEVEAVRLGPGAEQRVAVPKQRALEAITYLALRESSVDREDVQAALWPDGTNSAKSFSNAMWEARRALGSGRDGNALLPDAAQGRYSLSDRVVTDYGVFCELVARADDTEDAEAAAAILAEALELVRGEPFVGVGRSYAWVGPHRGMIVSQILDAAEELAEVRLATGDWRAAEWSARQGLRALPCDERMYRLLMRAAHVAGNTTGVQRAFNELCEAVADPDSGVEPDDTVHPDTVALLEELAGPQARRVTA